MTNDYTQLTDSPVHPGAILDEALGEHSITQKELSDRINISTKHINEVIKGKASITSDLALRLEYVFNSSASFWLNLQKNYEEITSRVKSEQQFRLEESLVEQYDCYKELSSWGLVNKTSDKRERYFSLLNFFGVSSLSLVSKNYSVQFRKGKNAPDHAALAAWLRVGEIQTYNTDFANEFNKAAFRKSLKSIRELTDSPIEKAVKDLRNICAHSGVALVFTPYIKNTYVNGATRWLNPLTPMIQLSQKQKRSDAFWFSFFHEAAHVLLHSKKKRYIDIEDIRPSEEEIEADKFAKDVLISPTLYRSFVSVGDFSDISIRSFARRNKIGTDIVAGRLAHDELIPWPRYQKHSKKIEMTLTTENSEV